MGLVFSISNFFITETSLANKWIRKKIPSCSNSALVHYAHECTNTIAAVAFYIPRRMSRTLAKTNFAPKMGKKEKRNCTAKRKKAEAGSQNSQ